MIVENYCRYGSKQSQTSSEQCLSNSGGYNRKISILLGGYLNKGIHNPPDCTKKSNEWANRSN